MHTLIEEIEARIALLEADAAGYEERLRAGGDAVLKAETQLRTAAAAREAARAARLEAARREAAVAEALGGLDARQGVLEDLVARREGTPAGARDLMARSEGCHLLAELLEVEAGYERAVAAALGPLAQAVVLGVPDDLRLVLEGDEVLEAIVLDEDRPAGADDKPAPAGTRDLWELVEGPPRMVGTLRSLLPPTAVVVEDVRLSLADVAASRGSHRLVNRRGEMLHGGVHVARRREMGVETLLRARNELQALAAERLPLLAASEEARVAAGEAAAGLERAEGSVREGQERLSKAERDLAGQRNDSDLCGRRLEEARLQSAELRARRRQGERSGRRDGGRLGPGGGEDRRPGGRVGGRQDRTAGHAGPAGTPARETVTMLEQKKAQAGLVEVRLRERCRAREGERERLTNQRDAAALAADRWERRMVFLERYLPLLVGLLGFLDRLAEHGRLVKSAYEARLEEARAAAEGAARLMRDTAGSESGLQQEFEVMGSRLAQLQVDRARQEDRRALVEEELAELRRKHLAPRRLTMADVAGENLELLGAAEERAARRLDRIGPVNPLAEQECAEMEERAQFLAEQRRDLEASLAQLQEVVSDLDEHIETAFAEIFEAAKEHFSAVIATVFPGAKGSLEADGGHAAAQRRRRRGRPGSPTRSWPRRPRPRFGASAWKSSSPNKSPRSLSLLSGGEKAMTAIAFLFSLFLARPCPFYILDEVEASLDDINIRRFLSLVQEVPGEDSVHHHHPPAADHGGGRHALRRDPRERRHLPDPFHGD